MSRTVFFNGKIYTPRGREEALLVDGQTIAAVGRSGDVLERAEGAERIDLEGRLMLPGFIDGHMHFLAYALSLEQADLTGARSVHEVRDRLKSFLDREKPAAGEWVSGRGWNHELFGDPGTSTGAALAAPVPPNPVSRPRGGGQGGVLNPMARETLGIPADSRFSGGVVDLDDTGRPTGVIRETAVEWAHSRTPNPDGDKLRRLVARAGAAAAAAGLTSIHSDDLGSVGGDWGAILGLYLGLDGEGKMPVRITEQLLLRNRAALDRFLASGWRTGDGSPAFHIGPLKILTDGSMGGRTAFLREEYSDMPGVYGVPIYTAGELNDLVWTAHSAGMQLALHAIGDGALDMCLDALEKARERNLRKARHYIVHCQMGDMDQYHRMARLGVGAAIQPPFVPSDRPMALRRIGEDRARRGYAWKTLLDLGIFLSGGSDCPVETFDPLWGIYTAVTRKDRDGVPEGGWNPAQKLTVEEAVDLYTRGGAYASFEEHKKGTLQAGKLADLVVLDRDIFSVPEEGIPAAKPVLTMMGGKITFRDF